MLRIAGSLQMQLLKYLAIGSSLLVLSSAALAFQEQKSGSAPVSAEPSNSKPVELSAPGADGLKPSVGTEVRIPGFGKLGSLPKMDFGLELLYGANEAKQIEPPSHHDDAGDLTIRGSVKHKF
jgi:hypothetical protein